ncbi:MAG: topoisomerase IV [Clostridia bacterium]|nr:topoisomerase IV [Clostridia bacterium]
MARKKTKNQEVLPEADAPVRDQLITETIETNYMPYVMSVIISRAIPEIDGFKPAHRKLLYTMYKMGLLTGRRTKSTNVVGQTMRLNPHGDAAIYETMVRLTRDHEALLHPFIDSKGTFGKQYSTDMAYAAARYTEVKLDPFCSELFAGIDENAVDMIDNYDGSMLEPVLFPTTFPNILVTPNKGIAVGMASNICSFNLAEVCNGAIEVLKDPTVDADRMLEIVKAPDFAGGANLIYNRDALLEIYRTGTGSFRMRARYVYDKDANCIDVIEIPYSTSLELIIKKIVDMIKEGKLKEVVDVRDEIDISGFKLTLDLRKGVDPDQLMTKLFKCTPLEDSFSCNFNVLINKVPKTMGIVDILKEWCAFRTETVRRILTFELGKLRDRLHLLLGLGKILLDIDKAIKIIRETKQEKEVVPNLMAGFGIDEIQAEFIAEIKLRHLNREYILNKVKEIEDLQKKIAETEHLLSNEKALKKYIIKQLEEVRDKYGAARKTKIVYEHEIDEYVEDSTPENYPVHIVFSAHGYFKKITMQSLRGNDEQSVKEGDRILLNKDAENADELLFFSDKGKCYKSRVADFDNTKASALGEYVAAKLGFDQDERCIYVIDLKEYSEKTNVIFVFENGKGVKVPLSAYETKGPRKRLTGAYSTVSPVVGILREDKPFDFVIVSSDSKAIQISSALIPVKATRSAAGVTVLSLKKNAKVLEISDDLSRFNNEKSLKKIKIPASGVTLTDYKPVE